MISMPVMLVPPPRLGPPLSRPPRPVEDSSGRHASSVCTTTIMSAPAGDEWETWVRLSAHEEEENRAGPHAKRQKHESGASPVRPLAERMPNAGTVEEANLWQLLEKGGCVRKSASGAFEYASTSGASDLIKFLESKLSSEPTSRRRFLEEVDDLLKEVSPDVEQILRPVTTSDGSDGDVICMDSVMRCLLNVRCIQSRLAASLLELIPQLDADDASSKSLAKLILSQFKWLDCVSSEDVILDKLLNVMDVTDEELQHDIIAFLPEVTITDAHAEKVGEFLHQKLKDSPNFLESVLEVVPGLCIDDITCNDLTSTILDLLPALQVKSLSKAIRFMMEHCTQSSHAFTFSQLRHELHFVDMGDPRRSMPDVKQKTREGKNVEMDVVQGLTSALRCKPASARLYLSYLKALPKSQQCVVLDLWLLIILVGFDGQLRKSAKHVMAKKILSGQMPLGLFHAAIGKHKASLREHFQALVVCANILIRGKKKDLVECGVLIFTLVFENYSELYHRQEILGEIITLIGGSNAVEIDAAISFLKGVTERNLPSLIPFASMLSAMLDHIDELSVIQIRGVFWVLGQMIYHGKSEASSRDNIRLADEVHILIRKQMASNAMHHCKSGVIATIVLVEGQEKLVSQASDAEKARQEIRRRIKHMIRHCCKRSELLAFCCEELANMISRKEGLSERGVLRYIKDIITDDFEKSFLLDLKDGKICASQGCEDAGNGALSGEPWCNLDGRDSPVCIRIFSLLTSPHPDEQKQVMKLASQLRLMHMLERKLCTSLHGIDALLGCPIQLFEREHLRGVGGAPVHDQPFIHSMIFASDWFCEVLNGFCGQLKVDTRDGSTPDKNIAHKIARRVQNLHFMEVSTVLLFNQANAMDVKGCVKSSQAVYQHDGCFDCYGLKDMGKSLAKIRSSFGLPQRRALQPNIINILYTVLRDGKKRVVERLPIWAYILETMNMNAFGQNMWFTSAQDMVIFSEASGHATPLLHVLKRLLTEFSDYLSGVQGSQTADKSQTGGSENEANNDDVVTKIAERGVSDPEAASITGIKVIMDLMGKGLKACDDLQDCAEFFAGFVRGVFDKAGDSMDDARELQELLDLIYTRHEELDVRFRVINVFMVLHCKQNAGKDGGDAMSPADQAKRSETKRKIENLMKHDWMFSNRRQKLKSLHREISDLIRYGIVLSEDRTKELLDKVDSFLAFAETSFSANKHREDEQDTPYYLLQRETVPIWFNGLFESLFETFQNSLANLMRRWSDSDFDELHEQANLFSRLVNLAKVQSVDAIQRSIVGYGQKFLDAMLKHGDGLQRQHKGEREQLFKVLKQLQKGIKILHVICSECKTQKASALASKVPAMKRTIERFVWKCRIIFHDDAFELGNLKHKNLKGEVLLSQLALPFFEVDNRDDGGSEEAGSEVESNSETEENHE